MYCRVVAANKNTKTGVGEPREVRKEAYEQCMGQRALKLHVLEYIRRPDLYHLSS